MSFRRGNVRRERRQTWGLYTSIAVEEGERQRQREMYARDDDGTDKCVYAPVLTFKVARVGHDGGASGLERVEGRRHFFF